MIDTHCHLTHARFAADVDAVVARAREAGVEACLTIGTGAEDARAALALAGRFPGTVFSSAGIDPFTAHRAGAGFDDELAALADLLGSGRFRALGEVGLDYHYDLDSPSVQTHRLERQLDLARRTDLAVVIHVREAHEDMLSVLARHPGCRGVIHSFTAGPAEAERYLDLGWHIGFNGVVTFRNAPAVREAAALVPTGRLLLETDSPYLAPVPLRGGRCEPAHVAHVLARLAEVRGEPVEDLRRRSSANARALFGLPPAPG